MVCPGWHASCWMVEQQYCFRFFIKPRCFPLPVRYCGILVWTSIQTGNCHRREGRCSPLQSKNGQLFPWFACRYKKLHSFPIIKCNYEDWKSSNKPWAKESYYVFKMKLFVCHTFSIPFYKWMTGSSLAFAAKWPNESHIRNEDNGRLSVSLSVCLYIYLSACSSICLDIFLPV